jgi:hypothetical protein
MSISLILTRGIDQNFRPTGRSIALSEWTQLVEADPSLKIRTAAYAAVNPSTGEKIESRAGAADSEIQIRGEWVPFLRYRKGELTMKFTEELLQPDDPVRRRVAAIAVELGALVTHDAGDELFQW